MVAHWFETRSVVDAIVATLFVPAPIWGPLLGVAVITYWLRRRDLTPNDVTPALDMTSR